MDHTAPGLEEGLKAGGIESPRFEVDTGSYEAYVGATRLVS